MNFRTIIKKQNTGTWSEPGYKLTFADIITTIVILLLAAAISFYSFHSSGSGLSKTAVIEQDGQVIKEINLDKLNERMEFKLTGKYVTTVLAENGRICIEASTCRDRICVGTGWLTKPGQSAVCLPNRVVVKIIGSNQEYDIISQ